MQFAISQSGVRRQIPELTSARARSSDDGLGRWLATLALVLIVIGVALMVASGQDQRKTPTLIPVCRPNPDTCPVIARQTKPLVNPTVNVTSSPPTKSI